MNLHARTRLLLAAVLLFTTLLPGQMKAAAQPAAAPMQGCTTLYAFDGQNALGGNNEDYNNPLTLVWFIPASPGRYGRVYFGFDDGIPQGGLNDQGVFFDGLALTYKAMPLASQRPHFPGGDMALWDEILSRSATVQEALDISSRWYHVAGEYAQNFYGDRFGDSAIVDGDTVIRKQGAFQLATNFRLVENPNPPYPEERYNVLSDMLTNAGQFNVELFRQALIAAHAEGDVPTLYSQVYELNKGLIHLYQFHDFEHEVVLNLADELAKGPHVATIASLFPKNDVYDLWAFQRVAQWKVNYEGTINMGIRPESQAWMSGDYTLQENGEAVPVKITLENGQLSLQKPNQLPIALYPSASDAVFHNFYNGMDLKLTFQRNVWGQATGAQGAFGFAAYNISLPYQLTRPGVISFTTSLWITLAGGAALLLVLGAAVLLLRQRRLAIRAQKVG